MGMDKDVIDIVIPYNETLGIDELKYCLRGIDDYVFGYRNVVLVGDCPSWVRNVIHLPCKDEYKTVSRNILEKVTLACRTGIVSDYFILFNDDYFFTKKTKVKDYPIIYSGSLVSNIVEGFDNWYYDYLGKTSIVLKNEKLKDFNYDVHYPLIINKELFIKSYVKFKDYWNLSDDKLLVKSLYGNYFNLAQEENVEIRQDCKIRGKQNIHQFKGKIESKECFSTGDECLSDPEVVRYIKSLYPNKSKYEY